MSPNREEREGHKERGTEKRERETKGPILSSSAAFLSLHLASSTSTRRFLSLSAAVFSGATSGFDERTPVGVRGSFIPLALSAVHTVFNSTE